MLMLGINIMYKYRLIREGWILQNRNVKQSIIYYVEFKLFILLASRA